MKSDRDLSLKEDLVLGLDLGSNSVGWALVQTKKGRPVALVDAGARVFDAGMDGDMDAWQSFTT